MTKQSVDVASHLGASAETSSQLLTLYIPNKDKSNRQLVSQRKWVLEAAHLLAEIGGGVTILPAAEGGWMSPRGTIVWEAPVVVYTFIRPDRFVKRLPALREFLHRLGRETEQGEVVVEFDGSFYRITRFDKSKEVRRGRKNP